jgi:hypothetical protein
VSNPALVAFTFRLASNNLTARDIAALTTALEAIVPSFPNPDETSATVFSDETDAREWISALYTIQANGETTVSTTRVVTPNAETPLTAPFAPGAGKVLLVADITPATSGLLLVSVNVALIEDATGVPGFAIFFIDNLTAITGGTLLAPGLTEEPTSTTPAFGTGVLVFSTEAPSFNDGSNPHTAVLTLAGVPVQAVVGHRTGIVVLARDTAAQNWTSVAATVSVVEQP